MGEGQAQDQGVSATPGDASISPVATAETHQRPNDDDHAERFGLAQLHQLRGRVGRGAAASHCLLINGSSNPLARQRLDVLVRSTDGFEIAEMDLRLRGPGQVLGTRQSGLPDLALASLADDAAVLEDARTAAQDLLRDDPNLERCPQLRALLDDQQRRLSGGTPLN